MTTQREGTSLYCPPNYVDREDHNTGTVIQGGWRTDARPDDGRPLFLDVGRLGANNPVQACMKMRDAVAIFLKSAGGSVSWQLRMVYRGFRCECVPFL